MASKSTLPHLAGDVGSKGPDPVRLLRVLADSLRVAAEFHEPPIADVLRSAADDMERRSKELGALTHRRSLLSNWKAAIGTFGDTSD